MRKHILVPTLLLAAGMSFATGQAEARQVSIEPVSWSYLMVACANMGGHFGIAGSFYSCTVEDCDGEGNACTIICDDEGGLETCSASVPRIHSASFSLGKDLLQKLGMKRLPALPLDSGFGSSKGSKADTSKPADGGATIY